MKPSQKYDALEMPNYSPIEAARYFHVAPSTVRYWAWPPNALVTLASRRPPMLSFKNLVEFYVLEGLRRVHGLHLRDIRAAVEDLMEHEESVHPLADFDLDTLDGRHVIFRRAGKIVNSSLRGQYEFPEWTTPYLRRVVRDPYGVAMRIFPYTKKEQVSADSMPPETIVIDPGICFGLPVLAGSRITTGFLASRYRGGDSVPAIAESYGRSVAEIKEAIEWETGKRITEKAA